MFQSLISWCVGVALVILPQTVFLIFLFVLFPVDSPAQVKLVEFFNIGADEDKGREYLLAGPRHAVVDAEGNIYLADGKSAEVRVFDNTGAFVKTIGTRGKGPGELQDVSAMTLNNRDELVVFDRFNQRVTAYALDGDNIETYPLPANHYADVHLALFLEDGSYVVGYKVLHVEDSPDPAPELFHIFDKDFKSIRSSVGGFDLFYDDEVPFHRALSLINPVKSTTDGTDYLYIAPQFYEGKIYRISLNERQTPPTVLAGHSPAFPAYVLLNPDVPSDNPNLLRLRHAAFGKFYAISQKTSQGLFRLSDGQLVHFSRMGNKDTRTFGVEVFDAEGMLKGYYPIEGYESTPEAPLIMAPLAVDKNDQFYISDNRDGYPVLRVVKLQFTSDPPSK